MDHEFTHRLYGQFARIGKAVGNGHRIALLHYLGQGERSVEALARLSGLSIANTSQHLQQLRNAGLVRARKAGQHVFYALTDDQGILRLLQQVQNLAKRQLAEVAQLVDSHFADRDNPVSTEELAEAMARGQCLVVDVRPAEEYAAGHIPGAVNLPLERLARGMADLPKERELVIYCRGPYSPLSHEAALSLRRHGYSVRRFAGGFPDWRLAGHPVAQRRPRAAA